MSRFYSRAVPLLAAMAAILFWSGCPTPPKRNGPATQVGGPRPAPVESIEGKGPIPSPVTPPRPVINLPATLPPPEVATMPVELPEHHSDTITEEPAPEPLPPLPSIGSMSLAEWTQQAGLAPPVFKNQAGVLTAVVQSPHGTLQIKAGDRYALWNTMQVGLGFAPMIQNGTLMVHSLDAFKNFQPLATQRFTVPRAYRVVVIDPGHGGINAGAKGPHAKGWEKEFTLDWALRIERLMRGSDWHVILTRKDDRDLTLTERAAIADSVEADLFISLHFNSAGGSKATSSLEGIETYCLTPTGMPSNLVREFGDDTTRILWNNIFDAENLLLGIQLHESLLKTTGRKDRGLRRARFMTVLQEQRRPAVLLEGGFLSHPQEGKLIGTAEFRETLARGVVNALKKL